MACLTLIFDLTVTDIAFRLRKPPEQKKEDLQQYLKEIGLSTAYFNAISTSNRVICLAAEPAVSQKLKLLGISDSPEAHLDLSAQQVTLNAAMVAKESARSAANGSEGLKTMGYEYAQQLQRGLCFIKRMRADKQSREMESKTVIVNYSMDLNEHTIELMTLFFTYQTFHEKIDVLDLSGKINPTLQQGCDITGGYYFSSSEYPKSLLGCLARNFFTSSAFLKFLPPRAELEIDYRYPCRCHNKLVDIGYICASCLSVHCRPSVKCVACGASFMPNIPLEDLLDRQTSPPPSNLRKRVGRKRDMSKPAKPREVVLPEKKKKGGAAATSEA